MKINIPKVFCCVAFLSSAGLFARSIELSCRVSLEENAIILSATQSEYSYLPVHWGVYSFDGERIAHGPEGGNYLRWNEEGIAKILVSEDLTSDCSNNTNSSCRCSAYHKVPARGP